MFDVCYCPKCKGKFEVIETRTYRKNEAHFIYRRKSCKKCGFRISTGEIPLDIVDEILADD